MEQPVYGFPGELAPLSRSQIRWQLHRAVAHAREPAHRMAEGFKQAPHLAVAALLQNHAVPAIGALALSVAVDALAAGGNSIQKNALSQTRELRGVQFPLDPREVLALQPIARMHQAVGKLARVGEE